MTWWALVIVVGIVCAALTISIVVGIGRLGGMIRPDFRRRKRTGSDGNSGK